jgi:hypothetical protein
MQQIIRFVGKISLEGQANGLPSEIYAFMTLQDANNEVVIDAAAKQFAAFRNMGGMIVEKNQGALDNRQVAWLTRMFVPFGWIVNITLALNNLTKDVPQPDETGVERLTDGSKAVIQ